MKMLRRIPADDSRVRLLVVRRLPPTRRRRYRLVYRILWSTTHQGDTKGRIAAARRNTKERRTAVGRIRGGHGRSDVRIRSDWIFLYLWAWYAPVVRGPPGPPCSSAPAPGGAEVPFHRSAAKCGCAMHARTAHACLLLRFLTPPCKAENWTRRADDRPRPPGPLRKYFSTLVRLLARSSSLTYCLRPCAAYQ